jgi:hypothetical protein
MHPQRSAFEIWNLCVVGLEGIARQVLETLVGGLDDVHDFLGSVGCFPRSIVGPDRPGGMNCPGNEYGI